ncbi:MAG: dipeptide/oligopeptide/nickel ABC transporter permease/ATP-binding protein [Anaerolineales bacterium]|nr:dipeptide/oligopeptide/nickel ABC transporter permease/ATP-binding protein [Anaerolineales bacterium]
MNIKQIWTIFSKRPLAIIGLFMLVFVVMVALFAPLLAPYDPNESQDVMTDDILKPPDRENLLGTDDAGKDVLSELIYGARVSLIVGFSSAFASMIIGTVIGLFAGFYGKRVDNTLMRITDFLLVIPRIPLMLAIISIWGRGLWKIVLLLSLLGWTFTARLVRSQTLTIKERQYVLRAQALGATRPRIIAKHIFPQVMPIVLAQSVLDISGAIITESVLAFLGLGDPTLISWGNMLNFAFSRAMSREAWWFLLPPGLAIVWVSLGLILIGTVLEEIVNPRLKTHHLFDASKMVSIVTGMQILRPPAVAEPKTILQVENLSVEYNSKDNVRLKAVDDVSLKIKQGQTLGIVGESGCGKTTLMLALLRLLPEVGRITSGRVLFEGNDILQIPESEMCNLRWADISIVFQGAMNALNPVRTIESQIAEVLRRHQSIKDKNKARSRVGELLELVGINADLGNRYPHQYSGGMRQRALIAMALACNPKILIADEPTTALDVMIQAQITNLLIRLQSEFDLSLIIVTHDLGMVAEKSDDVVVMYGGKVAEYSSCNTIYNDPVHPYTQRLLEAFPDITKPGLELTSIPGAPPRLDELPLGCRFNERCDQCIEKCSCVSPPLVEYKPRHWVSCHLYNGKE